MRDALMAASYAISLMLPLRLLLSLFLTKPKTHSGWYDSRWYGDVLVQPTPKPAPNFISQWNCMCIIKFNTSSNNLCCHQEIRCDVGFYEFPNPKSELIWSFYPLHVLARDGIKMAFFGPTHQPTRPASGVNPPYNGRLSSWTGHDAQAQALVQALYSGANESQAVLRSFPGSGIVLRS